tara:strand:+ start:741 stop:1178 length:438 start_codon:yes stop_codon:yes gene_type:complete
MLERKGEISDLKEIYILEKMIFKDEAWSQEMLKTELLNNENSKTLIIEEQRKILGYFMSRSVFEEHHILNLGVFPPRQKEGIGTQLLISFLKSTKNSSSVFLEVKKSNFPAIGIYKTNGFKVFGERKNYYKSGESALMMHYRKAY